MQKYNIDTSIIIPQEKRKQINEKILYLITNNLVEQNGITKEDIFNSYTGDGGLHGLDFKDFDNRYEYGEAKKDIEHGQFFTPHETCKFLVDCICPNNKDIIYDLTFGMGNFYNYLPVESNIYGTEIDIKAVKVAKYLYPEANLSHEDIRIYKAPLKADIVIGNPPFNLKWNINNKNTTSQMYFCNKAAEILKPAGLLAMIVPNSFLSDDLFSKSDIETMNNNFNFIVQFDLPSNAFKNVGVSDFETKIMIFQKKSKFVIDNPYNLNKCDINNDSEYIYYTFVKPLQEEREKFSAKIHFENMKNPDNDKHFTDLITKLLFDIKRNTKTNKSVGRCESILHEYLTQVKPEKMSYEEWEKKRLKKHDVIKYMQTVLSSANKVYRNEKRIVKNNNCFFVKDYSENENHEVIGSINDCVLREFNVDGFSKLIDSKIKNHKNQSRCFSEMELNPQIKNFLNNWTIYSKLTDETIKLTSTQAADTNKLLQKQYGILQYSMGAGKTLCGLAMAQYKLSHTNIKNVFVVGTAIAINNTWDVVLDDYRVDYIKLDKLSDFNKIQDKQIVIITLNMVMKFQRQLKKFIKIRSQGVMMIFDESDAISNPFSKRTKAMLSVFRKCKYKYLTTGTTTRNNICEIAPQLELLYNNSINYLSLCEYITKTDKDGELVDIYNDYYNKPIPAYRKGYDLFAESHLPKKVTVFGIDQKTQDIYNADILKDILDKTVITKSFEEVTGKQIYEIKQITVPFHTGERAVYIKAINEFESMRRDYFVKQENSRKDSMLKILQQLILLLKVYADPSGIKGYVSDKKPTKIIKTLELLNEWKNESVAVGVRHISVARAYERYIRAEYPDRPVFVVTGGSTTFKQRRNIVERLKQTSNGILISTQQALSASTNIDFIDKVLLPELHYNNAAMSQYYFRFIRFTSQNFKNVYFLTYENTIESNLLKMVLVKEKLNLFMKNEVLDDAELYERFGVDPTIIDNLMPKEYDEDGKVYIRWGEQQIV